MDKKSLTNFLKRQIFTIFSCLIVIILGATLISSALFTITKESNKNQTVQSGNFAINFTNGSTISEDIFIYSDDEGKNTTGYSFSVTNNGTIDSSYMILLGRSQGVSGTFVDNQYIRYSLDNEPPRTLSKSNIYSGSNDSDYLYALKVVNKEGNNTTATNHNLKVWIDSTAPDTMINRTVNLSIQVIALPSDPSSEIGYQFEYTGSEQTYTIPYTGVYTITATGAEGAVGNKYGNTTSTLKGGKGAKISGDFNLNKGDVLHLIVGGMGSTTTGSTSDGASGAGGGGSFIFKEIPSITNSQYQFAKASISFDTLLVAAGGSGTGDLGYSSSKTYAGYDANGADFKSPTNFAAYSTATVDPTASSSLSSVLGISQYINITYNALGGRYVRGSSICLGGYGGGGCSDDQRSYGGGWTGVNYVTYSWSQGNNTQGYNGTQEGNGYVNIKLKS